MNEVFDLKILDDLLGAVYVIQDVTKDGLECLVAFEDGSQASCKYKEGRWTLGNGPGEYGGFNHACGYYD